jgi:hypothetical protein
MAAGRRSAVVAVLGLAMALGACEGGSGPQEPPPTPTISISAASATVDVLPGGTGTMTINLTRGGGFAGPVTVVAEGLPTGVSVAQATIAAGSTSTTLNINAGGAAPVGSAQVTVRATGTGVTAATTTFTLNVVQPPGIQIALNPTALSVQAGASGTVAVNLTRQGGYAGAVTVTASGLPTGVTVAQATIAAGANTATLTVNAAAGATVGASPITITAAGTGVANATATLNLTVTAAPPAPAIAITLNPAALTVNQGASGNVAVSLTRIGAFTGAVNLTVEGLPAGVTVAGATIAEGATSGQLTVNVGAAAAAGVSNLTVRAAGTGVTAVTAPLALTVTQPPGFTMALDPGALTVAQGAQGQATITVARTGGFAGAVNLTASGAPAGMTVTFNPASVAQATSTVTVAAGASVAAGSYAITLTGAGTGVANQQATLNVTVTGGTSGGNVTFSFCEADGLPLWVAGQNGNGPWQRITGNAQHQYSFQVTDRGGIAYVTQEGNGFQLVVHYYTAAELQAQGATVCTSNPGSTRNINVNFANLGPAEQAMVGAGGAAGFAFGFQPTAQLQGVAPGVIDLVASRMPLGGSTANRVVIQRGINPANNATVNVDFGGAGSFDPVTHNLTVSNTAGSQVSTSVTYLTSRYQFGVLDSRTAAGSNFQFVAVPAAQQVAGDFHLLSASAINNVMNPTEYRTAQKAFVAPGDQTLVLGPGLIGPTVSVLATQPYARLRASYNVQPEYNTLFIANFSQDTRDAQVLMSAAYSQNAATVNLDVPDLSGVAGWQNTWGPLAGAQVNWMFSATKYPPGSTVLTEFVDGMLWETAMRMGTITP